MPAGSGFAPADVVVDAAGRPLVTGHEDPRLAHDYRWAVVRLTQNATPAVLDTRLRHRRPRRPHARAPTPSAPGRPGSPSTATASWSSAPATHRPHRAGPAARRRLRPARRPDRAERRSRLRRRRPRADPARRASTRAPRSTRPRTRRPRRSAGPRCAARRCAAPTSPRSRCAARRSRRTGLLSSARCAAPRCASPCSPRSALRDTTWQELLGIDVPLQTLTLDDALEINPDAVGALTLERHRPELDRDAPHDAWPRSCSASARSPSLPAPAGGWCAFLASQPYNCSNGVDRGDDHPGRPRDRWATTSPPTTTSRSRCARSNLGTGRRARRRSPTSCLRELDLGIEPFRDAEASEFAVDPQLRRLRRPQARRPDRRRARQRHGRPARRASCRSRACRT